VSIASPRARRADAAARARVEVRPVRSRRELRRFIRLPFSLYRDSPLWVPPLISERKRHLDRRNPFFGHAEAEYFLAWRDGEPVGRVSAHIDHRLNTYHDTNWGLFGFFESIDDEACARALLEAAEEWVRERRCDQLVGPMDFNTNHECGLLVDGHDYRPQILENWHHPYYARLLQGYGLEKEMDLLKWQILTAEHHRVLPVIYQLAERLAPDHGITVRHMRKRNLAAEMERFREVYNAAWQSNWGFVPLTDAEIRHHAKELRPILDQRWTWIAEKDGETVGIALTLRDYNQVLAAIGAGRLLPLGWLRALRAQHRLDEIRVFALGVKPGYQHTGVAAYFYRENWEASLARGIVRAETGWILEVNEPMNRAMEALGGDVIKRYRVFRKPI
jgi:GNAT superfamily N-acetyltransferase